MKRILNPSGGRPVKNEDIKLFEQFIALFVGLSGEVRNPLYIYGCEFNGVGIEAGLVYFDGDLCVMDAQAAIVYEFEKVTIESEPREYFDGVTKNSIETIKLVPQVGGSFTYNPDDPDTLNFASYMHLLASAADVATATNNDKVVTPSSLLSGLRSGTSYRNTDSVWGVARRATTTEGRSSTNNEGFLTSSLLKDAFQFGNFLASTTLKGVVEKATEAERDAGTADKYIDAALLAGVTGGLKTKTINIGTWNMDGGAVQIVSHGISDWTKIRSVSVLIMNDNENAMTDFTSSYDFSGFQAGGRIDVNATNVVLTRITGGLFDNGIFDRSDINRGFITIHYVA